MNREKHTIKTNKSETELMQIVSNLIVDKATFITAISKKKYEGKVLKNGFHLKTYDSPPIEVNGVIKNNDIELEVKYESLKESIKGIIYGLGYTFISLFVFWRIYESPKSISVYIIGGLSFLIPFFVYKFYLIAYYVEPDPKYIIKKLKTKFVE